MEKRRGHSLRIFLDKIELLSPNRSDPSTASRPTAKNMGIYATRPGITQRRNVEIPVTKEPDQLPQFVDVQNTPDNKGEGEALRYQETTGAATAGDEKTIHIQTELRRITRHDLSGGYKRHGKARSLNVPVAGS